MKLSVVISAFNEEHQIENCLRSVSFADEIIVVDNSSTDKTAEISKKYATVISQKNDPQAIDLLKNTGIRKASGDWVLLIDADEQVSEDLKREISEILKSPKKEGYWIPRKNIIFGKWIEHTGWWPDHQLRLFKKGQGEYKAEHVHEDLRLEGETDKLKNPILHHNYQSISQFLKKMILAYVPNEAEEKIRSGYQFSYLDAIRFPISEFISRYFAREGYKDGFHGLTLSLLMAFYHFLIVAFIWEKKGFTESNISERDVYKELKKSGNEINFWLVQSKIKNEKNLFKKLIYKLQYKLGNG